SDPYPSATAAMAAMVRQDGVYLLPAATQMECSGSATCSNRSLQWREKVIDPMFESRTDHMIMYQLAEKFGFAKEFVSNGKIKVVKGKGGMDEPDMEDTLREINRATWTIGSTGQAPDGLQANMRNQLMLDVKTVRWRGVKIAQDGLVRVGDYAGLPGPCYGTPALKPPGLPTLYGASKPVMAGGGNFRG